MTVLRVEIEENADLEAIQDVLDQLGLDYSLEDEASTPAALPDAAVAGINAGLRDVEEGRTASHAEAASRIEAKIQQLRARHGA